MKQLHQKHLRLLELLYDALREEYGIKVEVDNPHAFRSILYTIRRQVDDPALADLAFLFPVPNQLWIVKAYAKNSGEGAA